MKIIPKVVPIASKSDNSATWNGEQCVSGFLEDIRAGTIAPAKLMILWFSEDDKGNLRPHRWFAQMNRAEEVALLEIAKQMAVDEWKN